MEYRVRPISDRSPFRGEHDISPFSASWQSTRALLYRELEMIDARHVVLELDVREGQIRNDGMLRSDAKAATPAVRLAFESKYGELQYATDRYVRSWRGSDADWEQNVRAIALTLEALRKVERYGASVSGQQYAGYKQIGWTGSDMAASHMTGTEAIVALGALIGQTFGPADVEDILDDPDHVKGLARSAMIAAHPDKHDGSRAPWDIYHAAKTALRIT